MPAARQLTDVCMPPLPWMHLVACWLRTLLPASPHSDATNSMCKYILQLLRVASAPATPRLAGDHARQRCQAAFPAAGVPLTVCIPMHRYGGSRSRLAGTRTCRIASKRGSRLPNPSRLPMHASWLNPRSKWPLQLKISCCKLDQPLGGSDGSSLEASSIEPPALQVSAVEMHKAVACCVHGQHMPTALHSA